MFCPHLKLILILVPISRLSTSVVGVLPEKCDNSLCNYEAACVYKNNRPFCECIGTKYFSGEYCNNQVNNCIPNPCPNSVPCINALGQAICFPCPLGYGGHLCKIQKAGLFEKLYLHHNRYGYFAAEQRFLLTVESLGETSFLLELYADNYAIDVLKSDPNRRTNWSKSSDLSKIARKFNLHHIDKLPYRIGYYYVAIGRFWNIGQQTLRLKVTDAKTFQPYLETSFKMRILYKNDTCTPELELTRCSDPFNPMIIDVARFNTIRPTVRKRCLASSQMHFDWAVYDSIETGTFYQLVERTFGTTSCIKNTSTQIGSSTVLLHSYGQTNTPLLKVPPYSSWFRFKGKVIQVFLIRVMLTEKIDKNLLYTVARCYALVQRKPITAEIVGGESREVDVRNSIRLDGSKSRDFFFSNNAKSKPNYQWACSSDKDPQNAYCKKLKNKAGKLKEGYTYKFVLKVSSQLNEHNIGRTSQNIRVIATPTLYVDIECVRNCATQRFTPGRILHLRAICLNCGTHRITSVTWTVNGVFTANTKHLVIHPTNDVSSLPVQVRLKTGSLTGSAAITLKRNNAPKGGSCQIEPSNGIEYETEFGITCKEYQDDDLPFWYEIQTSTFILDRTSNPKIKLRLPETNEIEITICDSFGSCTKNKIDVSVAALAIPMDFQSFFYEDKTNLRELLKRNEFHRSMILVQAISKYMNADDVKQVCEILANTRLQTLLELEQYVRVIVNFLERLKPLTHVGAGALTYLLKRFSQGLRKVIRDGEILEVTLSKYESFANDLILMLNNVATALEKLPPVQTVVLDHVNTYNRILEYYPDFNEFDSAVLIRVNDWVQYNDQLDRSLNLLGLMGAYIIEPNEPHVTVQRKEIDFESFCIEDSESQNIDTKDRVVKIELNASIITQFLITRKNPKMILQLISTPNNPFWWYPDAQNIDTTVLYFSMFDQKTIPGISANTKLKKAFRFVLKVKNNTDKTVKPTLGRLVTNMDMNVFRILVPANTLLVIKFQSTAIKLRFELKFDQKPSGYKISKSQQIISSSNLAERLLLNNTKDVAAYAYLGIVPAEQLNEEGAFFTFIPELRQCLSWSFSIKDPQWTTQGCRPANEAEMSEGLRCSCNHLSTYAGKIYGTTAYSIYGTGNLLARIPINWYLVGYQVVLALIFFWWIVLAYLCLDSNRENLVTTPKYDPNTIISSRDEGEVVLRITTGGYRNATTTAGILVTFVTVIGPKTFKIYQNPQRPHLRQNSTCTVRLPLNPRFLKHPITVIVKQDGGGRYPTWYCRSTEINYVGASQPALLKLNYWIEEKAMQIAVTHETRTSIKSIDFQRQRKKAHKKARHFRCYLETIFINWFQFQPLFGPWKYGNQTSNRFERTLLWLTKSAISVLLVSYYFGWTSLENYEEERYSYQRVGTNLLGLFFLSFVCFFVSCTIQFTVEYAMLKTSKREYGVDV